MVGLGRRDADVVSKRTAVLLVLHYSVRFRKQSMVVATSDILARMDLGSPLANDDIASTNCLASKFLDSQSL